MLPALQEAADTAALELQAATRLLAYAMSLRHTDRAGIGEARRIRQVAEEKWTAAAHANHSAARWSSPTPNPSAPPMPAGAGIHGAPFVDKLRGDHQG
jgi:hypothetical protein